MNNGSGSASGSSTPTDHKELCDRENAETPENIGSEAESDDDDDDGEIIAPHRIRIYRSDAYMVIEDKPDATTNDMATATVKTEVDLYSHKPGGMYEFEWQTIPVPSISPEMRREPFSSEYGPTSPNVDPYSNFIAIWDREIMEHIVAETNEYAQEVAEKMLNDSTLGPFSRITFWQDVCVDELYTFFAIILAMGMLIKGRLQDYWNTTADIFFTPGFRVHMTLKRYQLLSTCLHFNRNGNMPHDIDHGQAKLYKIEPIVTHLNNKFQESYNMNQNVALDESLLQWSGWLNINQFIPNKAAHVGIKSYELCESKTGYLWRFEIHSHKFNQPPSQDPMCAAIPTIVLKLVMGLENKGHTLWMDNYYNSPALARKLKSIGFDCVGTLRVNRQFVPETIKHLSMRPGQIAALTSGDVDLVVWSDRNIVTMISTYHGNGVTRSSGTCKPIIIHDYNIMMGGVDKKDQMLSVYPVERKRTRVWYKKLFRRLLNVSVLNAYIIAQKSGSKSTQRAFWETLIKDLLEKHSRTSHPIASVTKPRPIVFEAKTHYIAENPPNGTRGRLRRKCIICGQRTTTHSQGCDKAMCMSSCFKSAH